MHVFYTASTLSTGIACTGIAYWLLRRRSSKNEKLEQMKKKLQLSESSAGKTDSTVTASTVKDIYISSIICSRFE